MRFFRRKKKEIKKIKSIREINVDGGILRIAIVDDVVETSLRLAELLDIMGFPNVQSYESPIHAEQEINNDNTDLIFMDIRMIEQNGVITSSHLRDNGYNKLIFGLTGDCTYNAITEAIDGGMDEVMEKPFDLNKFYDLLRRYKLDKFIKN